MSSMQAALANSPALELPRVKAPKLRKAPGPWASSGWAFLILLFGNAPMFLIALALTHEARSAFELFLSPPDGILSPIFSIGDQLCMIGALVLVMRLYGLRIAEYLDLVRPRGRYVIAAVACAAFSWGLVLITPDRGDVTPPSGIMTTTTIAAAIWSALCVSIVAPIFEELLFRGFLYRGLSSSRLGVVGAILITAGASGLLHGWKGPVGMAETALVGVLWGWLRVYTRSTLASMLAHVLNNGVVGVVTIALAAGWLS